MGILDTLISTGDCTLYHDYRSGRFTDFSGNCDLPTLTNITLGNNGVNKTVNTSGDITISDCTLFDSNKYGTFFVLVDEQGTSDRGLLRYLLDSGEVLRFFFDVPSGTTSSYYFDDATAAASQSSTFDLISNRSHCVVFEDGSAPLFYKDGVYLDDGDEVSSIGTLGNGDLEIGAIGSFYNDSIIQAVVITKTKLTASEISELHEELLNKKFSKKVITRTSTNSLIDTSKTGLVSAYDFQNGSLNDIVGTNHLTQSGSIDIVRNRLGTGFSNKNGIAYLYNTTPSFQGSSSLFFSFWYRPENDDTDWVVGYYESSLNAIALRQYNTGFQFYDDVDDANNLYYGSPGEIIPGKLFHIVFGVDSSNVCKMWVNGVPRDNDQTTSSSLSTVSGSFTIGDRRNTGYDAVEGEFYNFEVFTSDLTDSDVQEIYNRSQKIVSYFDRGINATGNTIDSGFVENTPFQVDDGSCRVVEETINGYKSIVLERIEGSGATRGTYYIDAKDLCNQGCAFGEWSFTVKNIGEHSVIQFISDAPGLPTATNNYSFFYVNDGTIRLRKGVDTLIDTAPTTYSTAVYHTVKITRRYDGLFTVYVDGASIGTYTDLSYVESNFINIYQYPGEKIVLWSENPDYTFQYKPFV